MSQSIKQRKNEDANGIGFDAFDDNAIAYPASGFLLADKNYAADIIVECMALTPVKTAASHLADDIYLITGQKPQIITSPAECTPCAILIGQLGSSPMIDDLVERKLLDVSGIQGQWESYCLSTIEFPFPGVNMALVIAGSDKRGTAYGVYELSSIIGVSPWHWFADVTPQRKKSIILNPFTLRQGPPSVKYRGIFINDESWGLVQWASKTFAPEEATEGSGLGPKTYSKICELLMRMKANYLCPGMHVATRPFNFYEGNKQIADDYGVIIGTSHCEPMLRNNEGEWKIHGSGPWRYDINKASIYKYWEDRVKTNAAFENIYTIGIRGVHDSPMEGPLNTGERIKLLEQVIHDQREILSDNVNPELHQVPQALYLYKEVLDLYRKGIKLPNDIIIVWPDDNHGYIRELPEPKDLHRSGGDGVYYHISYYGTPQGYLWLSSTPPALIAQEMNKAHISGADKLWVVNVGNLKNHEIAAEFFLAMAWDIKKWNINTVGDYYIWWAQREFGYDFSEEIAYITQEYFRLNHLCKPEHINTGLFSDTNYGDEAQKRIDSYHELVARADEVYNDLPAEKKDAFYQLVLYPFRCSLYMNEKFIYAQKNNLYAGQDGIFAEKSLAACRKITEQTYYYNNIMAKGKWSMSVTDTPHGLTGWTKSYAMPELKLPETETAASIGIFTEGSDCSSGKPMRLPSFNKYIKRQHFFDICSPAGKAFDFSIEADNWVLLSSKAGSVEERIRIWVDIDWEKAPQIDSMISYLTIATTQTSKKIRFELINPQSPAIDELAGYFVETNGYIAINACNCTNSINNDQFKKVSGLGHSKSVILYLPDKNDTGHLSSPLLEYDLFLFTSGTLNIMVYALPAHSLSKQHLLRYTISIDDHEPVAVDIETKENSSQWSDNVLRGTSITCSSHNINTAGKHKLKVQLIDPGIAIDKIVIDTGGLKSSYSGPQETRIKKNQ